MYHSPDVRKDKKWMNVVYDFEVIRAKYLDNEKEKENEHDRMGGKRNRTCM